MLKNNENNKIFQKALEHKKNWEKLKDGEMYVIQDYKDLEISPVVVLFISLISFELGPYTKNLMGILEKESGRMDVFFIKRDTYNVVKGWQMFVEKLEKEEL